MQQTAVKKTRPGWINRTVVGIALASLFSDMSHETVTAVLPAFLAALGASAGILGTIEGLADGLSAAAKLYGGWLADRLQRRKPLCAGGYAFMALASPVIAVASNWLAVLAGRVIAWVSRGLRTPARKALLADAVTPEVYGRAFGFERAMDTVGAIVAPLLVLLFIKYGLTQRTIILFSTVPALLAVLAIVLTVRESAGRIPVKAPFLKSFSAFSTQFKEFLGAVGLFGLGDFADTFYILYAISVLTPAIGPAAAVSLSVAFYALHNAFYAACSYAGGWAADQVNRRLILVFGYLCAGLAALCIIVGVKSYPGLGIMFALGGAGVGIYEAVEDTVAAELLNPRIRGNGFGVLAAVTGLGDLLSSVIVGWLWAWTGAGVAFGYALTMMLAGSAVMLFLSQKKQEPAR